MSRQWGVLGLILRVVVKMRSILNKVNKSREKMKLYCCLFPNDYEFERETLVRLWMAMEFSSQSCIENFCERYFDILLEEQYIVFSSIDNVTRRKLYKVNRQGNDNMGEEKKIQKEDFYTRKEDFSSQSCIENFCEKYFDILLEEQYIVFSSIDNVTRRKSYEVNRQGNDNMGEEKKIQKEDFYTLLEDEDANGSKIGHISVVSNCINGTTFKKFQNFDGELRTLLFIHNYGPTLNKIPSDMFLILECLRALDLSGNDIVELPRSIGNLSQLRYLDLSFTLIESLPKSIDQLHQLQTLKLQGCMHLHELPRGIKELICLHHLDLDVLGQLTFLPKGIGALTELCTLSAFIVDSEDGCTIQELKFLNKLRGSFCIFGLENVAHVDDVQEAALQDKKYLTHLQLRWSDLRLYGTEDKQLGYNIIASLNLNIGLQDLQIVCYPGFDIPAWVNFREQQNLHSITLLNCNNNDLSLPLGQLPNLKYLSIIHMNQVTKIDNWFHGGGDEAFVAFPKLESFEIECMLSLETWIDVVNHGDFPFLSTLIIKQCPELTRLPFLSNFQVLKHLELSHCSVFECLPEGTFPASLETLIIDDCPILERRCSEEGEDWHKVKHIPNIWIENSSSKSDDICSTDEDISEDINLAAEEDASLSKFSFEKSTRTFVPGELDINSTAAQGDTVPTATTGSRRRRQHRRPAGVGIRQAKAPAVQRRQSVAPTPAPSLSKPSRLCLDILKAKDIYRDADEDTSRAVLMPPFPSSKEKGVEWDILEAEVKKEEKEEDAALNKFLQDIYRGADEDTRRAMQKPFFQDIYRDADEDTSRAMLVPTYPSSKHKGVEWDTLKPEVKKETESTASSMPTNCEEVGSKKVKKIRPE